jgi:hypothetical protein
MAPGSSPSFALEGSGMGKPSFMAVFLFVLLAALNAATGGA